MSWISLALPRSHRDSLQWHSSLYICLRSLGISCWPKLKGCSRARHLQYWSTTIRRVNKWVKDTNDDYYILSAPVLCTKSSVKITNEKKKKRWPEGQKLRNHCHCSALPHSRTFQRQKSQQNIHKMAFPISFIPYFSHTFTNRHTHIYTIHLSPYHFEKAFPPCVKLLLFSLDCLCLQVFGNVL